MKTLAIGVLLAVMQAPPPIPRKVTNTADTANATKSHAAAEKQPTPQFPTPLDKTTAKEDAKEGSGVGSKDAKQTVKVTEFPTVSVNPPGKDWADWATWAFGLALAVTAALQVYWLRRTLKAIERQATLMEQQSRILVAQNRALLIVPEIETPRNRIWPIDGMGQTDGWGFTWIIKNCGNSPAFITLMGARFHRVDSVTELPTEPDIETRAWAMPTHRYPYGLSIGPGESIPRYTLMDREDRALTPHTEAAQKEIAEERHVWRAYGAVEYRTVFDQDAVRVTRFCYRWIRGNEVYFQKPFMRSDLPAEYTKQT